MLIYAHVFSCLAHAICYHIFVHASMFLKQCLLQLTFCFSLSLSLSYCVWVHKYGPSHDMTVCVCLVLVIGWSKQPVVTLTPAHLTNILHAPLDNNWSRDFKGSFVQFCCCVVPRSFTVLYQQQEFKWKLTDMSDKCNLGNKFGWRARDRC